MTDYVARAAEVFALVQEFVRFSTDSVDVMSHQTDATLAPTELADLTEQAGQERKSFLDRTTEYFVRRQTQLNELVEDMRNAMTGDADSAEVWRQNVSELKLEAISSLDALLSGISKPTERATGLKWRISHEEDVFNGALFDLGVGDVWQSLATLARDTRTMILNCDKEWGLLLSKAGEIQSTAEAAVTRLLSDLNDSPGAGEPHIPNLKTHCFAITQAAREAAVVGRTIAQLRDGAETAFDDYARTLDAAQRVVDGWRAVIPRAAADIATLKSLQSAEIDSLHRVFREKRQAAQDFAKEPPTQKARALRERVDSAWSAFPSRLPPSDGMRADARLLFDQLKPQLDQLVTMVDDAYAEFEKEFTGRFLGTVSDDTVEQLAQEEDWTIQRARFRLRDDPAILRTIKETVVHPASDADRAFGEFSLLDSRPAESERERASYKEFIESNRARLAPRSATLRAELAALCDQGIAVLEHPDVVAIVTREAVLRSLRS